MRPLAAFLVSGLTLSILSLVGCGGSDDPPQGTQPVELGDTGPARPTDCSATPGLELELIDDFELGAATGAFTNNEVCARCAELEDEELATCQDACVQSQYPTDFDKPLPAELIPDGRCGSRYALHVTTQSFHAWGGVIGFPFSPPTDVRPYEGIAFWGRVAWNTRSTVRTSLLDAETDSQYRDPDTGEARCEEENTLDVFQEGCDPFGAYSVMTGDWQLFLVPFDEMRQRGFGHKAPFLDIGAVRQLSIEYGLGEWDFWIDDLAFYRRAEGAE